MAPAVVGGPDRAASDRGCAVSGGRIVPRQYAATYAERGEAGAFGVDVIAQDVELDGDGREVARDEAGWSWHPAGDVEVWDLRAADRHLYSLGWVRVGPWEAHDDLAGMRGWTCEVRRDDVAAREHVRACLEAVRQCGPAKVERKSGAVVGLVVTVMVAGCSGAAGGAPTVEPMPRASTSAGPVVVESEDTLAARMLAICEPDLRAQLRDAAAAVIEPSGGLEWVWWDGDGHGAWNLGGTLDGPVSGERPWSCWVIDARFPPSDPARWDADAQASVLARVYP